MINNPLHIFTYFLSWSLFQQAKQFKITVRLGIERCLKSMRNSIKNFENPDSPRYFIPSLSLISWNPCKIHGFSKSVVTTPFETNFFLGNGTGESFRARYISSCSGVNFEFNLINWFLVSSAPARVLNEIVILSWFFIISRILAHESFMPDALRRYSTIFKIWYASTEINKCASARCSFQWKTGRRPSEEFIHRKAYSIRVSITRVFLQAIFMVKEAFLPG